MLSWHKPVRSQVDYLLIGARCKGSNVLSQGVLIDRGLDLKYWLIRMTSCCAVFRVMLHPTAFLVLLARWNHTDSIPNSDVKRRSGDDTWWVTAWENNSVPGIIFNQSPLRLMLKGALVFWEQALGIL